MRLSPLSGRKACDRVQRSGTAWRGKFFSARYIVGYPRNLAAQPKEPRLYLGTFASAALDASAVRRNRMRRRCKEALRLAAADLSPITAQLLVSPRSASLDAPFPDIVREAEALLAVLSHACHQKQKSPPPASSSSR